MKLSKTSGVTLAAAAAALLIGGAVVSPSIAVAAKDKGWCMGINACKGKGECKSASSACKGKNECKGKGALKLSKADCDAKKGKFDKS